jgi:tricorn protease
MSRSPALLATLLTALLALSSSAGATEARPPPLLLQHPSLSANEIAFDFAGEIWVVARSGGEARLLIAGQRAASGPIFSPDGSQIAFTATYDGNMDVYVVGARGGEPRRLTYHPGPDVALGWTPDGTRILFRSKRASFRDHAHLYTVAANGGFPDVLPLPSGQEAAFSPDGRHLAYTPFSQWQPAWKQYRGGQTSRIWLADLSTSAVVPVPRQNSNDRNPIWVADRIYFLSDRDGPVGLYAYDDTTHSVRTVVANEKGPDISSASAGPGGIVYSQLGALRLYEFESGRARRIPVTLPAEHLQARGHFEKLDPQVVLHASLSPTGKRVIFEARGDILSVPVEKGDSRNLTHSPGVADRDPAWSPDGKWIAWLSDESGEYALHLRAPDGMGPVRKISLGSPPSFFYAPIWSPDSRKIAYTDKRLNLWMLDLDRPTPVKVDTDRYDSPNHRFDPAWSPDSRWIAYTKQLQNHQHGAFVWSVADHRSHAISDGRSDVGSPQFDRGGRYLYLLASTDAGLGAGWLDMSSLGRVSASNVYALVLSRDGASPMAPESDEEGLPADPAVQKGPDGKGAGAADKAAPTAASPEVKIDFDQLGQRIVALPIPAANYTSLIAGTEGILYTVAAPLANTDDDYANRETPPPSEISRFDLKARKVERIVAAADPQTFALSSDGSRMLFAANHKWFVTAADKAPKDGEGAIKTEDVPLWIDPRAEWRQIYQEAWRIERDFLYDPNLQGLNLAAAQKAYAPYVDGLASRADLNTLLEEMTGHIAVGHTFINGGAMPAQTPPGVGLLGADYRAVNGHVQFAQILEGENWNPRTEAPLTRPGVRVNAGEYLLAVNGTPVDTTGDVYRYFEGLAGRQTALTVGPTPDGKGSRTVTVVPAASEEALRLLTWMESNRRHVEERSGGQLGYVFLPDTGGNGFTNFNRYFYSQVGKQGVILDERFNHGGDVADFIVDQLKKTPQAIVHSREGDDMIEPAQAIFGPKVMLVNEESGSGGDALPWLFKKAAIGPLVGTRTWGGLVGISLYPPLIDGGSITAPRWAISGTSGEWEVENIGIPPDVEVVQDPALMKGGADPQLDRAIDIALDQLTKSPHAQFRIPPAPDRHPVLPPPPED